MPKPEHPPTRRRPCCKSSCPKQTRRNPRVHKPQTEEEKGIGAAAEGCAGVGRAEMRLISCEHCISSHMLGMSIPGTINRQPKGISTYLFLSLCGSICVCLFVCICWCVSTCACLLVRVYLCGSTDCCMIIFCCEEKKRGTTLF